MNGAPIDLVLDRLQGHKLRMSGPNRWRACCPAHNGKNPSSLSIGVGTDGAVLLRCWVGCDVEAVAHALGLELADLFATGPSHRATERTKRLGLLTPAQCLEVMEAECELVWTAAFNLANGHALTPKDLQRLHAAATRIQGLIREVRS